MQVVSLDAVVQTNGVVQWGGICMSEILSNRTKDPYH